MITCVVEYVIDPAGIDAFERFARRWMDLVDRIRDDSGCVLRYERTFMRPLLPAPPDRHNAS
ncbi:hypothetical protein IRT45_26975 [Nocardia sp. BSTN01]|uniref:hypothetical protein n=1 Tax=Nocardia sp. BSTN01 TaxID=2783665 RepID=UPI00188E003F|nr:hypothetical protein [Nocardia sp. BSTN01]MBF5000787.1 hypothetical protein [Nocardia sp. BSTN01]